MGDVDARYNAVERRWRASCCDGAMPSGVVGVTQTDVDSLMPCCRIGRAVHERAVGKGGD